MNDELLKKLPFSLISEQSLLGSVIISPAALDDVVQIITADDFYMAEHAEIFSAIKELFANSKEITFAETVVTLKSAIKDETLEMIKKLAAELC